MNSKVLTNGIIAVNRRYPVAYRGYPQRGIFIDTFHGDAHEKNVLVRLRKIDYENVLELKLCDFGTSAFSGKDQSFERHWRVVRETVLNCTSKMESVDYGLQVLKKCEEQIQVMQNKMKNEIENGRVDFYDARIFTAPYKDYLEWLEFANRNC